MALRQLFYLRAVLFLTLLLAVLYSPEPRLPQGLSVALLFIYALLHFGLVWSMRRQKIPPDWSLYASLLDIGVITLVIYATSGLDVNLYIAYFVAIIGALLMENLLCGFIVAGIACSFYGITAAFAPEAFSKPEHLLPFAMLIVASFFSTFLSSLIHEKRRALAEAERKQVLWREHLAASRRLFNEVQGTVLKPMDRISTATQGLTGKSKDDILWEIDGIRGQFKRMGDVFGQVSVVLAPMDIEEALERTIYKLGPAVHEKNYEIDITDVPRVHIAASKEHLATFFYSVFKEIMGAMPAGGKIAMTSEVRAAQWWELGKDLKAWLRIEITGTPMEMEDAPPPQKEAATDSGAEGVEWILDSHNGRFDERTAPGAAAPRYALRLPVCDLRSAVPVEREPAAVA
ncbi:MAG: hypothetical protein ABIJ96_10230 [Elusimicrobiota bacterium]